MHGGWRVFLGAAVLLVCLSRGAAKRFDCENFCKTTHFSGMVGGCRCGFTLFTSKRSGEHRARTQRAPLPLAYSEDGDRLVELPRHAAVREGDLHLLMPYLFLRAARARGQREVPEEPDFRGRDEPVFGNMYQ